MICCKNDDHGPILGINAGRGAAVQWCRTCGAIRHVTGRWEEPTYAIPATFDDGDARADLRVAAEAIDRLRETKNAVHGEVNRHGTLNQLRVARAIGDILLALEGLYSEASATRDWKLLRGTP